MSSEQKFNDVISKLLVERLNVYKNKPLTHAACLEIYQTIFNVISDVFQKTEIGITNEMMNYVAQCYYDCIQINQTQELDPNIFTQRAKLENINTDGLAFLATLLKGTDMFWPILAELKKRS